MPIQTQMHLGLLEGTMTYASRCPHCLTDNFLHSDPNSVLITCVSCSRAYGKPEHPAVKVLRHECAQLVYRLADADSRAHYAHQEVNYYKGLLIRKEEKQAGGRSAYSSSSAACDSTAMTQGFADLRSDLKTMFQRLTGTDAAALQTENADLRAENADLHAMQTKHEHALAELAANHAQHTAQLEEAHAAQAAKAAEAHAAQAAKAAEAHAAQAAKAAEAEEARAKLHAAQIAQAKATHEAALAKEQKTHQQHVARATARVGTLVQEQASAAAEVAQLKTRLAEAQTKSATTWTTKHKRETDQLRAQVRQLESDLAKRTEALRTGLAECKTTVARAENELTLARAQAEKDTTAMQTERQDVFEELDLTKTALLESKAALAKSEAALTKSEAARAESEAEVQKLQSSTQQTVQRAVKSAVENAVALQKAQHMAAMATSAKVVTAAAIANAKHSVDQLQAQVAASEKQQAKLGAQLKQVKAARTKENRDLLETMKKLQAVQVEHKKLEEASMWAAEESKNLVDGLREQISHMRSEIDQLCSWGSDQENEDEEEQAGNTQGGGEGGGGEADAAAEARLRQKKEKRLRSNKTVYRARPQTLSEWSKRASDAEDNVRQLVEANQKLQASLVTAQTALVTAQSAQVARNVQLNALQTVLREIGTFVQVVPSGKTKKKVGASEVEFPTMSTEDILQAVRKTVSSLRGCVELALQFVSRVASYTRTGTGDGDGNSVSLDVSSPEASLAQMKTMLRSLTRHELMFVAQHATLRNTTFVFEPRQMDVLGDVLFDALDRLRSFIGTVSRMWATGHGVEDGNARHVAITAYKCLGKGGEVWTQLNRAEGMALLFIDTRINDVRRDWPLCLASVASKSYTRDHVQLMLVSANGHVSAVLDSLFRGCSFAVQAALVSLFNGMCLRVAAENPRMVAALQRASVTVQKALVEKQVPDGMQWAMFSGEVEAKEEAKVREPTTAEVRNKLTKCGTMTLTDLVNSMLFAGRMAQIKLYTRLEEQGLESIAGNRDLGQVFDLVTKARVQQLGKEAGAVFARDAASVVHATNAADEEGGGKKVDLSNAGYTRVSPAEYQKLQEGGPDALFEVLGEKLAVKLGFFVHGSDRQQSAQARGGGGEGGSGKAAGLKHFKTVVDLDLSLSEESTRNAIRRKLLALEHSAAEAQSIASCITERLQAQIDRAPEKPNELHIYLQRRGATSRETQIAFVVVRNPDKATKEVEEEEEEEEEEEDEEEGVDITDLLPDGCSQLHVVHTSGLVPAGFKALKASQMKDATAQLPVCGGSLQPAQLLTAVKGSDSLKPTRGESIQQDIDIRQQVDSTVDELAAKTAIRERKFFDAVRRAAQRRSDAIADRAAKIAAAHPDNTEALSHAMATGDATGVMRVLSSSIVHAFDQEEEEEKEGEEEKAAAKKDGKDVTLGTAAGGGTRVTLDTAAGVTPGRKKKRKKKKKKKKKKPIDELL